jgi:hypothetical protein
VFNTGMNRRSFVLVLALAACGGAKTGNYKTDYAGPIAIQLVNQTSRPIEEIFIFPRGEATRGTSWVTIPPGASATVNLKEGMFELVAKSAKRRIDERWVETPESTTLLELREDLASTPRKLVFHDAGQAPAGLDQPGTLGVTFMISAPEPAKTDEAPTVEEAPPAP